MSTNSLLELADTTETLALLSLELSSHRGRRVRLPSVLYDWEPRSASTEAATGVIAGLSAKNRRTYWEVSAEGSQARQQWTTDFKATVNCNEEAAAAYWGSLSKRQKDRDGARTLGEHGNMARVDCESKVYMAIDVMHEELRRYRELELRVEIPPALFKCGQSVLQWWASWMKDAKETPASYNKKTRPAWFSEEVTSFRGYGDIKYAGQMTRDHQYNVY